MVLVGWQSPGAKRPTQEGVAGWPEFDPDFAEEPGFVESYLSAIPMWIAELTVFAALPQLTRCASGWPARVLAPASRDQDTIESAGRIGSDREVVGDESAGAGIGCEWQPIVGVRQHVLVLEDVVGPGDTWESEDEVCPAAATF